MKKVLIITYYWPPSGGSGVQRWLKFTKYLPDFNWQPYIFTPENPSFEVKDESLIADVPVEVEVFKLPIWEPYQLLNKISSKKKNQQSDLVKRNKQSLMSKIMLWIRGNMFIPDPRIFWVKPASKVLEDLIISNEIDVIVTTGPPHSMHLIGNKIKQKLDVKWVADFRDPWSKWELFDNFFLTGWARRKHKKLERKVLENADAVLSVSDHYAMDLQNIANRPVFVITNGFDDTEFAHLIDRKPDEFIIRHIGVVDELRDPRPFLEAVRQLGQLGNYVKVEFVGNINQSLRSEVKQDEVLSQLVEFKPYVPHNEVLQLFKDSAVLLLILADSSNSKGNIPGKLFEYLASKRPVLAIGDEEGDSAKIINSTNAGRVVGRKNIDGIKKSILELQKNYLEDSPGGDSRIENYSRKNLTKKLASILDQL